MEQKKLVPKKITNFKIKFQFTLINDKMTWGVGWIGLALRSMNNIDPKNRSSCPVLGSACHGEVMNKKNYVDLQIFHAQ